MESNIPSDTYVFIKQQPIVEPRILCKLAFMSYEDCLHVKLPCPYRNGQHRFLIDVNVIHDT